MSKGNSGLGKAKEEHHEKQAHPAKEVHGAVSHAKEGHSKEGHSVEIKKSDRRAGTSLPGGCVALGCKVQANRFNFCDEHFDHFKFGLLKKTGEPVSDYEKKIEHFYMHKMRKNIQKVA